MATSTKTNTPKDGAGDLGLLPFGQVKRADPGVGVDAARAHGGQMRLARGAGGLAGDGPRGGQGCAGQEHVLEHRQVAHQRHLPECGPDAQALGRTRAVDADRLAIDRQRPGMGPDQARQEFHHRRLACPFLARQGMGRTVSNRQVDPVNRPGLADQSRAQADLGRFPG